VKIELGLVVQEKLVALQAAAQARLQAIRSKVWMLISSE